MTKPGLLARALLLDMLGLVLVGIAWAKGLVAPIFIEDTSYISHLIAVVFLAGSALAAAQAYHIGRVRAVSQSRVEAFRARVTADVTVTRNIAGHLVLLGLIGTVVGFIMALSGIDPATAGDPTRVGAMVATLVQGMGVALYTTLVGSILNFWLSIKVRMVERHAALLIVEAR